MEYQIHGSMFFVQVEKWVSCMRALGSVIRFYLGSHHEGFLTALRHMGVS